MEIAPQMANRFVDNGFALIRNDFTPESNVLVQCILADGRWLFDWIVINNAAGCFVYNVHSTCYMVHEKLAQTFGRNAVRRISE